ncbi:transmembrane ascorbate-dependent reductase CYB561 isoform X2 [Caretta caretta]|uniref:transmembrane ascorbate-dependent reductase CYB561 isoform X2 n=1 Tax=Caretta caretta TaxID=8467 RepID=UPI0020960F6E|nr:transmembrane ascorbate-dependent reductase CYB561 isoform X2 [Caretta caretta]
MEDSLTRPSSPAGLSCYMAVSQLLGLTVIAMTGAWMGQYRGGIAWESALQFNVHPLCMIIGMVFLQGDGVIAVFDYHRKKGFADMYSLHSWCGITAFSLYFIQWLMGFSFFLFPGTSFSLRSRYKPQHVFFGVFLLVLSIATCLLGIKELLLFNIQATYSSFVPEGILANVLGLLLIVFGLVIGYILTRDEWKRPPLAEELALSMDFKTLTKGESPSGSQ